MGNVDAYAPTWAFLSLAQILGTPEIVFCPLASR